MSDLAGVDSRAPQRRALVLACGRFADPTLPHLRSPVRDAEALTEVLADQSGPGYAVSSNVDCTAHEARLAIEEFFATARSHEVHLLYFSCHGIQNARGDLYFAFADTRVDFPDSTAVSAEWVRLRMQASRSRTTIVLVDCCFSGAFMRGMQARSGSDANVGSLVRDLPEGNGVAVLTASGATEYSLEDAEGRAGAAARPSYFTEAVVTGISTGAADLDGDGHVTVDELYSYVYQRIVDGPSPQRPRRMGHGEGRVVIASVPHQAVEPPLPPAPPELDATQIFTPEMQLIPWPPLPTIANQQAGPDLPRGPRRSASPRPPVPAGDSTPPATGPRSTVRRRQGKAIALAALLIAICGPAIQLGWNRHIAGHPTSASVAVPDVLGQQQAAAEETLDSAGLRTEVVEVAADLDAVGKVVSTDPPAGTVATRGSTVTLSIGSGSGQVTVPDLTGTTIPEATTLLQQTGLTLAPDRDTKVVSDPRLIDKIVDQDPDANTQVATDTQVRVTIGIGAGPKPPNAIATVIDVTGQSRAIAKSNLEALGLKVVLTDVDSTAPIGTIVGQDPEAGAKLNKGATVTLQVSLGNQIEMPDLRGLTVQQAQAQLRVHGATWQLQQTQVSTGDRDEDGKIVDHDPQPGQPLEMGQTIQVQVGVWIPPTT